MPDLKAFFARVDAHLATLDPEGRAAFLDRLTEQWIDRYADFQARVHRGAPTPAGTDAYDFLQTISGLDQRAGKMRSLEHA